MDFNTALPEGWQQSLPDDIKDSGVLAEIKDVSTMAKMAVDWRKLQSDHIRIPGENATPEAKQAFMTDIMNKVPDLISINEGDMSGTYDKMGRPKDAISYDLGEMTDDMKTQFGSLTTKAHELGLSSNQMRGIADTLVSELNTSSETNKQAVIAEQAALKEKWGQAYDQRLVSLSHFVKQTGFTDDFANAVGSGQIEANNMLALEKVMGGFEGDGITIGSQPGDPASGVTPAQAEEQLNEIMGNKESAYWDASNPAHAATKNKVNELVTAAEAGKKKTEGEAFRQSLMGG